MKLFVPGRICLFGEHTDWAGGYRRENPSIEKGYCLITGTSQGLYADVESHQSSLVLTAALDDGSAVGPWETENNPKLLKEAASADGFFSYAAGVALEVVKRYKVGGLKIHNYQTDLPVKKGLSSSAAVCVLVARAFNKIYNLSLSVRDEMELAYLGELNTGSQCGRMDQGCAFGSQPVLMTFDGDNMSVDEVNAGADFHFVIVDLNAKKDTKRILHDLNKAYPFPGNNLQENVLSFLGPESADLTHKAVSALKKGDAIELGKLMSLAQRGFDEKVAPACPEELTAPALHRLLGHEPLQDHILGGKGVGSQGDGTAQLLVKDNETQRKVMDVIEKDLEMSCLELTIPGIRKVRKAVIPAAGFGTRLFPVTKNLKKEFFPIMDSNGQVKPVIMAIVEEAIQSGIEEICLVVQEPDVPVFESFFCDPPSPELYKKLSAEARQTSDRILELGERIRFAAQKTQDGFGHAVHCAAEFVGDEPFLLMLGDHLFSSENGVPCAKQAIDIYEETGKSVVGLQKTPGDQVRHFGTATGRWLSSDSNKQASQETILEVTEFAEKPNLAYAAERLCVEGLDPDTYLTLFGMYVLKPAIMDYLGQNIAANRRERGEFQLTSCLDELRDADGFSGFLVQGKRYDMGHPEAYFETFLNYRG